MIRLRHSWPPQTFIWGMAWEAPLGFYFLLFCTVELHYKRQQYAYSEIQGIGKCIQDPLLVRDISNKREESQPGACLL